jgi:hypothetical protein
MNKKTTLEDQCVEAWRWNVNPAWTHFSAMIQDGYLFSEAHTEFEKHRISKSCLYFGVAAVEAFINQELRDIMRKAGQSDDEIFNTLKGGKNKIKWLDKSPFSVLSNDVNYTLFNYFKEIRNEVTHPKRKDQLIHDYLNITKPQEFINIVKYILVKMCELQGKEFQYWMLGWNYVGLNNNALELFLGGNLQSFYHSLRAMHIEGYDFTNQINFSTKHMNNYDAFLRLQKKLDEFPFDIELKRAYKNPPRLTRKWWDKQIILAEETFKDDPNNTGCKLVWAVVSKYSTECADFYNSEAKAKYISRICGNGFEVKFASHNPKSNVIKPILL